MNTLSKLNGYKTYLNALAIGIASAVHYLGWVDTDAYILILGILTGTTAASIKHAITSSKK